MKSLSCLLALGLLLTTPARAGSNPDIILLAASFNDQPLSMQIGTGGATLGQPVSIASQLQAFVAPAGVLATPSLRITPLASGAARFVVFRFLGEQEISAGEVRIGFVLKPAQLDNFIVNVRESTGAANEYTTLRLSSGGNVAIADAATPGSTAIATYTAGATLVFELRFRMDNGRYDVFLNGLPIAANRAHGIATLGVGSVWFGSDSSTTIGSNWFIDDVYAYRPDEFFSNGFE